MMDEEQKKQLAARLAAGKKPKTGKEAILQPGDKEEPEEEMDDEAEDEGKKKVTVTVEVC